MKLEKIFEEWDNDSVLDRTKLDRVALSDVPKLHAKYLRYLAEERLVLKKYEGDYNKLKLEKYEFYVDGPTQEQINLGWKLPAKGRILKSDAQSYIDADQDIIDLSLKIGLQKEKIEVLKSIVDLISRMGYQIRSAIDFMKFMNGG